VNAIHFPRFGYGICSTECAYSHEEKQACDEGRLSFHKYKNKWLSYNLFSLFL
jgi:hypothetical protein